MSTFEDLSFSLDNFSGQTRLFPLPNLVMFPQVMQPLHIFETRYREMIEDALADDGLITMVLLAPGWENNYEGRPSLHSVACLGRVTTHVRLDDGTYNVLLLGLRRVKLLSELKPNHSFREAKVEIYEDVYPYQESQRHDLLRHQLHEAFMEALPLLPEAYEQLDQLIGSDVSLGMLTDIISFMLDIDPQKKQTLLSEFDVYQRTEMLLKHLWAAADELQGGHGAFRVFPPEFSEN